MNALGASPKTRLDLNEFSAGDSSAWILRAVVSELKSSQQLRGSSAGRDLPAKEGSGKTMFCGKSSQIRSEKDS